MSKRRQWRLRGRRKDPRWIWEPMAVTYRAEADARGGSIQPVGLVYRLVKRPKENAHG